MDSDLTKNRPIIPGLVDIGFAYTKYTCMYNLAVNVLGVWFVINRSIFSLCGMGLDPTLAPPFFHIMHPF